MGFILFSLNISNKQRRTDLPQQLKIEKEVDPNLLLDVNLT